MNRKVLVTIVFVAVIFFSGVGYIVINNIVTAFKPVAMNISAVQRATVSGNGGNAVIVGDYVYFIGNYVDTAEISYKQNEYNKVSHGALYRARLDNNQESPTLGLPLYDDADREQTQPGYVPHLLKHRQLIVPKIAGFESSALYVFDKYLIYTSPNNTKNRYGQLQTNKLDFFRVDLDGRNHTHIYTTSNDFVSASDFTVAYYGSKHIYILIKDGNNLRRVSVTGDVGKTSTISNKVTSFALPVVSAYNHYSGIDSETGVDPGNRSLAESYRGAMQFVYYTEELSEDDQKNYRGNILKRYRVSEGKSSVVIAKEKVPFASFSVKALSNRRLLYTINENVTLSNSGTFLYMTAQNWGANDDVPFASSTRHNNLVSDTIQSEEQFYLPTEYNPASSDSIFASTANDSLYIYRKLSGSSAVATYTTIPNVQSIIAITSSTVYFTGPSGTVMTVSLYGDNDAQSTGWTPDSLTRLTFFGNRIFYVKTFEADGNVTNSAMMIDLVNDKEFVLGRIADKYLPESMREQD